MLWLGGPQSLALWQQAPLEGPLSWADLGLELAPRRLAGPIRQLCGERRAEGRAEVRVLASSSVGPSVLAQMAFKIHRSLEGSARSPTLNDQRRTSGPDVGGEAG